MAETKTPLIVANDKIILKFKWNEIKDIYRKTLVEFAKNVKAEGFRQGKAPLDVVEKKIGLNKIVEATLRELLPAKYVATIKEKNFKPLTRPSYNPLKIEKDHDWEIEVEFAQAPKIELKDYKKLVAAGKKSAAKFIKEQNEKLKTAASAKKKEKTAKKEQKAEQKADEKMPSQLSPDQEQEIKYQHIFRELVEQIRPSIAELLLREEVQNDYERLVEQLKAYKIGIEDYLKQRQISIEQLSNELAGNVLSRLQLDFIMAQIAIDEKVAVTETEIKAEIAKIKDEKLKKELETNENYRANLEAQLIRRKTVENLLKD